MSRPKTIRTAARSREALRWMQHEAAVPVCSECGGSHGDFGRCQRNPPHDDDEGAAYQRDAIASANSGSELVNGPRG